MFPNKVITGMSGGKRNRIKNSFCLQERKRKTERVRERKRKKKNLEAKLKHLKCKVVSVDFFLFILPSENIAQSVCFSSLDVSR